MAKVTMSYGSCSFLTVGMGTQECPLCHAKVPEGVHHTCAKPETKKVQK